MTDLCDELRALPSGPTFAVRSVDVVLAHAGNDRISDIHFEPTPRGLDIRFRLDGVLHTVATLPSDSAPNVVARLKVLADLLTYRQDIPQEGGVRPADGRPNDLRVSTFPTVHGEKAVVRVFRAAGDLLELDRLGLPPDVYDGMDALLRERTGAIYLTGPSGSGKTTAIYACLRRLSRDGSGRHVVTIEDPVERVIEGVTQSQARPGTEFDFARGLRSLLRQDPDVIMVGEIRDRETAAVAAEAALTGHLVFSTLHAGSACGVIGRLLDMGIEPFLLTSGTKGLLNQRLVRRLCERCKRPAGAVWEPVGCPACGGTGYAGRFVLAELLCPDAEFRRAILAKADTEQLESVAALNGWRTIRAVASEAIADGRTTPAEIARALGPG